MRISSAVFASHILRFRFRFALPSLVCCVSACENRWNLIRGVGSVNRGFYEKFVRLYPSPL